MKDGTFALFAALSAVAVIVYRSRSESSNQKTVYTIPAGLRNLPSGSGGGSVGIEQTSSRSWDYDPRTGSGNRWPGYER